MGQHDKRPHEARISNKELKDLPTLLNSPYAKYVMELKSLVVDKVVADSSAGNSGYFLRFADKSWLLCYLSGDRLEWRVGTGEPSAVDLDLLHSSEAGSVSGPLRIDYPYAGEENFIGAEVAKCHRQRITGIAIGHNSYNLCFPDGRQLEAMLVADDKGKIGLRVFWEQW